MRSSMVPIPVLPDSREDPTPITAHAAGHPWSPRELTLLFGITLVGVALRLFRIEQWSLSAVEATTWRAVTQPFSGPGGFLGSAQALHPLAFVGQGWLFVLGLLPSQGEGWWRLPYAFAGMLTVPLLAMVGGRVIGRFPGLAAGLLLALHPWHIAVSQTAAPAVLATLLALLAVAASIRFADSGQGRWRKAGIALVVLAGVTHPSAWALGLWVGLRWLLVRWPQWSRHQQRLVLAVAAVVVGLQGWLLGATAVADPLAGSWLAEVRLPTLLVALLAAWSGHAMAKPLAAAVVLPVAIAGMLAPCFGPRAADAALIALPPLLGLAALGALHWFGLVRSAMPLPRRAQLWAGSLAMLGLCTWLSTDSFLQATAFQGERAPWRKAAYAALGTVGRQPGLRVAADSGAASLSCYLRPNQWRDPSRDAHPGLEVRALDLARREVLDELLEPDVGGSVVLVLRLDEWLALQTNPAAKQSLQSFVMVQVLPCPQATHDATLYVLHYRPER